MARKLFVFELLNRGAARKGDVLRLTEGIEIHVTNDDPYHVEVRTDDGKRIQYVSADTPKTSRGQVFLDHRK